MAITPVKFGEPQVIAATGHRPPKLGGYGAQAGALVRSFARDYLGRARPDRTISGMALGWDTAVAQASADLGIPFIAAVPFEGQEAMWPLESRQEYDRLLTLAVEVKIVSPGGYGPAKMQTRNRWMVDNATRLVALWDGSPSGTGKCIGYAERVGRPWQNLWPDWQRFTPA